MNKAKYPIKDEELLALMKKYPFLRYHNYKGQQMFHGKSKNLEVNYYNYWDGNGWEDLWKNRYLPRLFKEYDKMSKSDKKAFIFKEIKEKSNDDTSSLWRDYIYYGGLPMVVIEKDKARKAEILHELLKETYLSDIIDRNNVKNDAELEELFSLLASNIGALTNPNKLANTFVSEKKVKISHNTIKTYIDYFIDSFLIHKAVRYDIKGKKYIDTPYKYYFAELGLRNALLNFRQVEPTHIMENIIYNHLIGKG